MGIDFINNLFLMENIDVRELSPLALAHLGDAVYEVLVRQFVLSKGNMPAHKLHKKSVAYVRAQAQSTAIEKIMSDLSEKEQNIYKRGRNANSGTIPKHADIADYKRATGLETLFGYLYIEKEFERIKEIFFMIIERLDRTK